MEGWYSRYPYVPKVFARRGSSDGDMSAAKPRGVYLLLGFSMNLLLGTAYAWSVFAKPLQTQFGATSFTVMLPFAVQLALFSVGMVFAGRLVDRHGPRKVAILGGRPVGAGGILSAR